MKARYLGFTFGITGFFLGVLVPLFARLMTTSFWRFGLELFGLMIAFFLIVILTDVVEINIFEWFRNSIGRRRQMDGGVSSARRYLYSFGAAFLFGLAAALIFSPTTVLNFLGKVLDNPLV